LGSAKLEKQKTAGDCSAPAVGGLGDLNPGYTFTGAIRQQNIGLETEASNTAMFPSFLAWVKINTLLIPPSINWATVNGRKYIRMADSVADVAVQSHVMDLKPRTRIVPIRMLVGISLHGITSKPSYRAKARYPVQKLMECRKKQVFARFRGHDERSTVLAYANT
jgi:hypothetical protein